MKDKQSFNVQRNETSNPPKNSLLKKGTKPIKLFQMNKLPSTPTKKKTKCLNIPKTIWIPPPILEDSQLPFPPHSNDMQTCPTPVFLPSLSTKTSTGNPHRIWYQSMNAKLNNLGHKPPTHWTIVSVFLHSGTYHTINVKGPGL